MAANSQRSEYTAALPMWKRCRDAAAGQDAVHAAATLYLPKLSEQSQAEYDAYKCRALYYNATGRTVDGMSGLVFRRPPTFDLPAGVEYLEQDVGSSGQPLLAFCEHVIEELLQVGRIGLLTDYPDLPQSPRTAAEERATGARPYVKGYCAESIINWQVEQVGGVWQLTLVVLAETYTEKTEDQFTAAQREQWRVLRLTTGTQAPEYLVEIWRRPENDPNKDPVLVETKVPKANGGKAFDYIPFVICNPMGVSDKIVKPPIKDLADVNLSHYRTTADYEHGLHFTGLPTPIVTGHTFQDGEKFALGSTEVKGFGNAEAKAFFLEFQGQGLTNLSKRLEEKERMMVALGARMLAGEQRQVEAAETAAIHRAGESSVLASLANAASQAIGKSLTWAAQWAGTAGEASVELNTDYLPTGMTAQELTALVDSWQKGAISHETLYDNLQRGEIAQQGVDFKAEKGRLEAEGPKLGTMDDQPPTGGTQ